MSRISISKTRKRISSKVLLILAGSTLAVLITAPLARLLKSPGFGELDNAEKRSAYTRIVRVDDAIRRRKVVSVNLRNKEARFQWPPRLSATDPQVGLPLTVEYLIGKRGRIYVTKVELEAMGNRGY